MGCLWIVWTNHRGVFGTISKVRKSFRCIREELTDALFELMDETA
jgi:hypothetical protein